MTKLRNKFLLIFLTSAFFLLSSSIYIFYYIDKLNSTIIGPNNLKNAVDGILLHSNELNNIINRYSTSDIEKLEALRSEYAYSESYFQKTIELLNQKESFKSDASLIAKTQQQYKEIADKIIEIKNEQIEKERAFDATLSDLEEIRHKIINDSGDSANELRLEISNMDYFEKEFNFQYADKKHAEEWLSSINSAKNILMEINGEKNKGLLSLVEKYRVLAEKDIAEKNYLIDLRLKSQYQIVKLDNVYMESKLINSKIIKEIDAELSNVLAENKINKEFLLGLMLFMFMLGITLLIKASGDVTKSIEKLEKVTRKILNGRLDERVDIKSNDEIGSLANVFNEMLNSINKNNEELREESAQMKALVSSMGEGLLVVDRKSNIIIANGKASNILRIPYKYLIGKDLRKIIKILINIEELPPGKWPVDEVVKSGAVFTIKPNDGYYLKTEAGRIIPVEMTIAPLSGKEINRIVILFKDITESKLIEEEREFSRQNLESVLKSIYIERDNVQEEKTKLEALLNSIGDAVLATDENKQVIAFNPIAQKITGSTFNELEGEYFDKHINFVDEETKKVKNDFIDKVLKNGVRLELNNLALINKKGHLILIDIDASPIKNSRGDIIGCIIVFKDVTEKREADRMRTDFISIVSHQLRTPLSAMKWFLEILMDGDVGTLKPKQKDIINDIHDSNKGMIEFVNQMLNVSRIESKRLAVNPEKLNLNKIAQELLKESSMFLEEKQQKLNYRYLAEEGLEINVDRSLLQNLLSGLVLNASRYTQRNGNVDVEITRCDKNYVLFKIKDDGIGIPESEHEKIFKKFSRASNAIRFEANGTGLGLYIVKSIVNMVCGKIWFESEENKGSTFYFTLPIENMVCEIEESRGTKSLI